MDELLSYCGLKCSTCPIYLATKEKDDKKKHKMRVDIAQQIKKRYGQDCKAEDVTNCDGCKADDEKLLSGSKKCQIRKCARGKDVENCAHCGQYPCEKLQKHFATEPEGKETLDKIRSKLNFN